MTGGALVPVKRPPRPAWDDRIHDGLYDRATADEIVFRMAHGEFLAWICRDPRMPSYPDAYRWVAEDLDGFRARYEAALQLGHDYIGASILEDAEAPQEGERRTLTVSAAKGHELKVERYDMLEHRKLKIATKVQYLKMYDARMRADRERLSAMRDEEAGEVRLVVRGGLPEGEP